MKKHLYHYIILLIILGLGAGITIYLQFDRQLQTYAAITTSASYVLWGIVHHKEEGSLHPRVLIEYLLLALLGSLLLISIISRA